MVPCSDIADFAHTPEYIRVASRNPAFLARLAVTFLKFLDDRWRLVDSVCLDSCLHKKYTTVSNKFAIKLSLNVTQSPKKIV